MKNVRTLLVLAVVLALVAVQAGRGSTPSLRAGKAPAAFAAQGHPAPTQSATPSETPPSRFYDDWAGFISGLSAADDSNAFKKLEGMPAWQEFVKSIGVPWTTFDSAILDPMKKWAGDDLRDVGQATMTLLYPFGGPDFITAFAFFPNARKTVLMGLEPTGNLPDFEKRPAAWTEAFFMDFDTALSDFLKRGYFVTKHMNEVFAQGRVDGALPIICFFLKRTGHSVTGVELLTADSQGDWVEKPYKPLKRWLRRPYGVRIDYVRPGDGVPRSVDYFSCDLSDPAFTKGSALFRLFEGYEGLTTYIKSGSYLLHYGDFANIRNLILAKSQYVLEDDTGIPYRYFKRQGWGIQLFGAYTRPVDDFSPVLEQPDLREAYRDPAAQIRKLPFHFGYHWVSKIDNLLLFTRPGKTAKES